MKVSFSFITKLSLVIICTFTLTRWMSPSSRILESWFGHIVTNALLMVLLVSLVMMALFVLCGLVIQERLRESADLTGDVTAGSQYHQTGFTLPLVRWFDLFCDLGYQWAGQELIKVKLIRGVEHYKGLTRAELNRFTRQLTLSDVFGLVSVTVQGPLMNAKIKVRPHKIVTAPLLSLKSIGGGADQSMQGKREGDLTDYRLYQPGDPSHRVLWTLSDRAPHDILYVRRKEMSADLKCALYFSVSEHDDVISAFIHHHRQRYTHEGVIYLSTSQDRSLFSFSQPEKLEDYLITHNRHVTREGWSLEQFIEHCKGKGIHLIYYLTSSSELIDPMSKVKTLGYIGFTTYELSFENEQNKIKVKTR